MVQLSAQDRIATLEAEIFALQARKPPPSFVLIIKTHTQQAAQCEVAREKQDELTPPPVEESTRIMETGPHRSPSPDNMPAIASIVDNLPSHVPVEAMHKHPFGNAKDMMYVPPPQRNASLPVRPIAKKTDLAYHTLPAIHDTAITTVVYKCTLDSPLTIPYHELLSLSPKVRSQVRDAISSKRVPTKDVAPITTGANLVQDSQPSEEELAYLFPDEEIVAFNAKFKPDPEVTVALTGSVDSDLPDDTIIVDDPIDRYY